MKIEDLVGFNRTVQLLSSQASQLCKLNEIAKVVGITRYYATHYLQALQDTYVVRLLRPYYRNLGKSLVKTPKLYFVDTGIRNAIFRQFGALQMRADRGQLVENFVFSELLKRVSQDQLWFFRTRNGSEIDFIFETGQGIIPIEVKYSLTPQKVVPRMFASMQGFPDVRTAYVLTRDSCLTQTIGKRSVKFLPVWAMHYLEL